MTSLDLTADPIELTAALVDVPSVSGEERQLADQVEVALRAIGRLEVARDGDTVLARTELGKASRVLLAGHLDTVPIADNVPSRRQGELLFGCGTSDMKSGDAVMLAMAAALADTEPWCDLSFVFYDHEEVSAEHSGLLRVSRDLPAWLRADFAILLEPTNGAVEAGCQGTMRATIATRGRRAHSARSWLGANAIHAAGEILARLNTYQPRRVIIDGCEFREGLNAVGIMGGVAGNVVPDECSVTVNFRFAPDRSEEQARTHLQEVFAGFEVLITDSAPGALPGLTAPAAQRFIAAMDQPVVAKYGWTDVSRFSAMGIPAINFGPGDPGLAHTREEHVNVAAITRTTAALRQFLFTPVAG